MVQINERRRIETSDNQIQSLAKERFNYKIMSGIQEDLSLAIPPKLMQNQSMAKILIKTHCPYTL